MPTIVLFSHLERVGPIYDQGTVPGDPWIDFWLSVNCAFDATGFGDDKFRLKTWNWADWRTLQFVGFRQQSVVPVVLNVAAADVKILNVVPTLNNPQRFYQSLEEAFDTAAGTPDGFLIGSDTTSDDSPVQKVTRNSYPWMSVLGNATSWPGGLNQWMHLSICFRIKQSALNGYEKILAAPVVEVSPSAPVDRRQAAPLYQAFVEQRVPGTDASALKLNGKMWDWPYAKGAVDVLPIALRQNPCTVAATQGDDEIIDLLTLRTKSNYVPSGDTQDWMEDYEWQLCELFDLPRALLTYARQQAGWLPSEGFHDLFIASLRDIANSGRWTAPDQSVLALEIAADLGLTDQEQADALQILVTGDEQENFNTWLVNVNTAMRQTLGLPAVSDPKRLVNPLAAWSDVSEDARSTAGTYLQAMAQSHDTVVQQETLSALLLTRWSDVKQQLRPDDAQFLASLARVLSQRQLRKRMLLSLMGNAWPTRQFKNIGDFKAQAKEAIYNYVLQRADQVQQVDAATLLPRPAVAPLDIHGIAAAMRDLAEKQIAEAVVAPTYDATSPDVETEGLLLELASFRSHDPNSTDDSSDITRRIAGAGVFLQGEDDAATAWSMLNYALLADADDASDPLLADPVPAPIRLQYRNGVMNASERYVNLPLVTGNPVPGFGFTMSADSATPPMLQYRKAYGKPPRPKLKAIQYGKTFYPWLYYIGHGGHLPAEIADPAAPWRLLAAAVPARPAKGILFQRRKGFGAVRFGLKEQDRLKGFAAPAIPADVRTISESVAARQKIVLGDGRSSPAAPALVLLADTSDLAWDKALVASIFEFCVYSPSTDLDTWNYWVGQNDQVKDLRKLLRQAWLKTNSDPNKQDQESVDPDDPGVREIWITPRCIYGKSVGTQPPDPAKLQFADILAAAVPGVQDALAATQRPPFNVQLGVAQDGALAFKSGTIAAAQPGKPAPAVAINVPKGEVWEFEFRPVYSPGDVLRYHPELVAHIDGSPALGTPHGTVTLRVEVADKWDDRDKVVDALMDVLKVDMPSTRPNLLQVSLTPVDQNNATIAKQALTLAKSATLQVQRWRWNGRPLTQSTDSGFTYGFPFDDVGAQDKDDIDGLLFGDRGAFDRYDLPFTVDYLERDGDLNVHLEERNLATLLGSLYFHHSLSVESRYAPLLLKNGTLQAVSAGEEPRWRQYVTPCRNQAPLPPPSLRIFLPLTLAPPPTDATASAPRNPSLLAVFDDRWYRDELAGIAEELEVQIVRAALPDGPADAVEEFGLDPIVDLIEDPFAEYSISLPEAIGPIGYTFDTATNAPLFVATSFVQPAPVLTGDDGQVADLDLSWCFVQLRFRRTIAAAARLAGVSLDTVVSDWTAPVWVQILPPSNVWQLQGGQYADITDLAISRKAPKLATADGNLVAARTGADGNLHPNFTLFALLTSVGVDASGRSDQESYIGLQKLDDDMKVDFSSASAALDLRVRLVEMQHRDDAVLTDILKALFEPSQNQVPADASARVVRMSPPVSVE